MNNQEFFKSFRFVRYAFSEHQRETDNRHGITCHFLGYLRRGQARFVQAGEPDVRVEAGDFFYIPLGAAYQSYWCGDDGVVFDSFAFPFFPDEGNSHYKLQNLKTEPTAEALTDLLVTNRPVTCADVGRCYQMLSLFLPRLIPTDKCRRRKTVERATAYMREHTDYSIRDVARHCSVSESGLYDAFRHVTGNTPIGEKHRILAERGIALLTSGSLSVEEVSNRLGLSSAAYFRKILREVTGKTPRV